MSLTRRNRDTFPLFPNLFDDFFDRPFLNGGKGNFSSTSTTIPSVNVKETADVFEVEMAAPGMQKNDFNITLDGNTLTISSERQHKDEREDGTYSHQEFSYQSFQRSFVLPKDVVEEEGIIARYENGVLHLTIPKKEEAKQKAPRRIEIG